MGWGLSQKGLRWALALALGTAGLVSSAHGSALRVAPGAGEVVVSWDRAAGREPLYYLVYRAEGRDPDLDGEPFEMVKGLRFVDTRVTPGVEYRYAVIGVDRGGARGDPTAVGSARAAAAGGPKLTGVTAEPTGRPLKPGDVVTVTVTGQPGAQAQADVGALASQLVLREKGRTGRYTAGLTVRAADLAPSPTSFRVVARLTDPSGTAELAGPMLTLSARAALADRTPPTIAKASHDGWKTAGFSGKLVAGDLLTVTAEGEPGASASFVLGDWSGRIEMKEVRPGSYAGTYTVKWSDHADEARVVVRLTDAAGNESRSEAGRPVAFDTRVRVTVVPRERRLPADGRTPTRLLIQVADANGEQISGHVVDLCLVTAGDLAGEGGARPAPPRRPAATGDARVSLPWGGASDAFGEVSATFAPSSFAERVFVLAKDLTTGDVGVGWLDCVAGTGTPNAAGRRPAEGAAARAAGRVTAASASPAAAAPVPPSDSELRRAQGAVFAPSFSEGRKRERARLGSWLAKAGDKVEKGQPLVTVETSRGRTTLEAPARGVLVKALGKEGDRVEPGDVVAFVEIDERVWARDYAQRR